MNQETLETFLRRFDKNSKQSQVDYTLKEEFYSLRSRREQYRTEERLLFAYQENAVNWILSRQRGLVWLRPGMGKTHIPFLDILKVKKGDCSVAESNGILPNF